MSTVGPSFFISALSVQKEKWKMCIFIFWIWPRQTHTKTRRGTRKKCNNHFGKETHFLREKYEREKLEHLIEVTSTSAASSLHLGRQRNLGESDAPFLPVCGAIQKVSTSFGQFMLSLNRCSKQRQNMRLPDAPNDTLITHTHTHTIRLSTISHLFGSSLYMWPAELELHSAGIAGESRS